MRYVLPCGLLLLLTTILAGCFSLSIGEKTTVVPSTGEQLTHLKAAYDSGALTETEFQAQKMAVLRRAEETDGSNVQLATFEEHTAK